MILYWDLILVIFQILLEKINSGISDECEIGNYCTTGACSTFGNCKIDIYNITNETNFESRCECNIGFSSYDIDVLKLEDSTTYCCYEQKSQFNAFLLEIILGFGIGHFYIGDIKYGLIKFFLQLFLCFAFCCLIYRACNHEHTIVINLDDLKKEEYKINDIIDNDEMKELNENIDNDKISEKEKKNIIEDEEEKKFNEILTKDLIKCPVFKGFIYLSLILFVVIQIIDLIFLCRGYFKDENGEDLAKWY